VERGVLVKLPPTLYTSIARLQRRHDDQQLKHTHLPLLMSTIPPCLLATTPPHLQEQPRRVLLPSMDSSNSKQIQPVDPKTLPSPASSTLRPISTFEPLKDDDTRTQPVSLPRNPSRDSVASSGSTACRPRERSATLCLFLGDDSDINHARINGLTEHPRKPTRLGPTTIIDRYPEHDSHERISVNFYRESLLLDNNDNNDNND